MSSLPWYALYVKHQHEKFVTSSLDGKGYESFLPTYTKVSASSKKSELPLFPGYVFCRLDSAQKTEVVSTPGVFSIVGNASQPAPIPEQEIEKVKEVLASGLTRRPWPYLVSGQEVCIRSGPLRGVNGVVVDDTHERWLVLSLHLLQRSVAVKVERAYLT